ncbi:abnormal spindle-like microcephaly-associated protein homolog [Cynara cardunculus var. scolymus]|uniref:abnormal spindle-like microcephaly-associated protein homolog n=1 Tax=Cynara cardunculus var. scolymus TaxID=59895 RepID=UPI000D62719D|nr:abnormal spindle-like microcephaly-associated protein homolog [Cynara cardunculus var. scolymus]
MEPKQQPQQHKQQIPSSPLPNSSSSSSLLLRDISNYKTPKPKRPFLINPSFDVESPCSQFFTALKRTPKSSNSTVGRRPRCSFAAKKLKAIEIEQSISSRKTQTNKEKSLKSLAKSLTVWLNFLFENPRSCGVEVSRFTGEDSSDGPSVVFLGAKRDSVSHGGVEVDREWRGPKRRKDTLWVHKGEMENQFSSSIYSRLQASLGDVCSLDDMKERMTLYLSLTSCKEIFDVMTHVSKNIDEGRLKMKAHCPIVTDVGMKEKALKILMGYNPVWLRIGLYIIFGGESLLPNPNTDMDSEQEVSFLKMVAEKLFFSHSGLAKAYIYNKLVDGLYRPGYYEKLGSVILKKFLLLALILDRAKSQSSLPISYGVDGIDGGSPSLFTPRATIKSSSEVISDFLSSDVMHGVGNLLAHLMIIGYKVSYQQNPLVKYVFKVADLFNDLQDGILLCRVIQLLQHDPSILKKVVVPSDDRKKNLVNCEISVQYLKQIGVPLCDEDGTEIIAEDIVNGDKELIISLLWNMFVHLQLPLLVNNKLVSEEITKIRGPAAVCQILPNTLSHLDMVLEWIKAICENYDLMVENFASLMDGKGMWCLLDYYFRKEHCKDRSNKVCPLSIMSTSDYVDAVHNFLLSQKLTTLLGNFPEVLQVSDILEYKGACNERGVIILLVFLSSQLTVKRNLQQINFHKLLGHGQKSDRKCIRRDRVLGNHEEQFTVDETCQHGSRDKERNFKAIMSWWQEMAQHNSKANVKPVYTVLQRSTAKQSSDSQREKAAKIIQSHFRRSVEHQNYTRIKKAVSFLQAFMRVWLMVKNTSAIGKLNMIKIQEPLYDGTKLSKRFSKYLVDRHAFIKLRRSVVIIQRAMRYWTAQKCQTNIQMKAALRIQVAWRNHVNESIHNHRQSAATLIQTCYRCWLLRKSFLNQKQAAIKIQTCYRGYILRKSFLNKKQAITVVQSYYRGFLLRKSFLDQKQAAIRIQTHYRGKILRKSFVNQKQAATKIQSHYRGWFSRNSFLNQKQAAARIQSLYRGWFSRNSFLRMKQAVTKLQRLYRIRKSLRNFEHYKLEIKSAVTIQSHARGWIARRVAFRHRCFIVLIQSFFRVWLTRREFVLQKEAAIKIQSAFRRFKCFKAFNCYTDATIVIQQSVRGCIARKRLLGVSCLRQGARTGCNHDAPKDCFDNHELKTYAIIIQSGVRGWIARRKTAQKRRTKSAIVIQSWVRGWIARKTMAQRRHRIVLIQSYWKGYIERKHSRGKLSDIRLRVQKSAANVDDGMRIINRLSAALLDLKNMKSVSGILHTCATLDMATKHSRKCCEKLVDAGAIDELLGLIRSISRSIVDQQVLRHAISIFRNLTRYPHLTDVLIDTRGSGETILWEFIRNKEDTYYIAADLLRNICSNKKGVERLRNLHALVKRLYNLVEDLKRKAGNEKRNPRNLAMMDRRLKEAAQILKLITNG